VFEISYSQINVEATVLELAPKYQQDVILTVLNKLDFKEADADLIGMLLLGDHRPDTFVILTRNAQGPGAQQGGMWGQLKHETYELFCTDSKKYDAERKQGTATVKNLVTILATTVGGKYSLPAGVLAGVATLCVMTALKMGLNAYCQAHAPQ
jgi:hypothetical protein